VTARRDLIQKTRRIMSGFVTEFRIESWPRSTSTVKELDIFSAALELPSPEERACYLDQACGDNGELRRRIEELLASHAHAASFMNAPAPAQFATVDEPITERPGTVIGPYKLMEQIGEGGMGLVFVAEQQQPVRRKVALKVIKPGMDTRQVIARFEAERQALALMDHPNIAKVLDGGTTGGEPGGVSPGRPYFVMELVKGVPITEYCDQNQVPIRERLGLFLNVCEAVQHAHQKGIIHRDIKPSNVLVMSQDGKPVVRVIDFGIAKAMGQQLTDKTIYTQFAQLVGTPLYMSPEQAGQSGLDVDTRSDIYSLGVLLYELLTGTTPFDKERLKEAGYDEMRRIIREEEPARPSTRISTLGQAASTISTQRQSDPRQLSRLFRGELDWIVMKALEKDRNRRYETASAFASDVQRYLADEPVLACPPSAWYRLGKYARRNKAGLATAGVILFFLVLLGSGAAWVAWDRAAQQRETEQGATAALAQAKVFLAEGDKETDNPPRWQATVGLAEAAVQRAEELLALGKATADLTERLRQVREAVSTAQADSRLAAELERIALEKTVVKQDNYDSARAAPRYAAVLRGYGIDLAAPAEAAARVRHSRLREALLSAMEDWWRITPDAVEKQALAAVLQAAEPAPDAFRARWREGARRRDGRTLAQLSAEPGVQGLPAVALIGLAHDLGYVKEYAAAERVLRAGQERYRSNFWLNHDLGVLLMVQQPRRPAEAVPYLTAALALRSDRPGVYVNLGKALHEKKDLEGAIREFQAAIKIDRNYATAHYNLGVVLRYKKELEGAIREFQAAIRIDRNFARAHLNLGVVLHEKNDLEGAIREYEAALKSDPNCAKARNYLGSALRAKGDLEGAIREDLAAIRIDPNYAKAHNNLGNALRDKKDLEGAIREYLAAIKINPNYALAHNNLGNALLDNQDLAGAIRAYKNAIRIDPDYANAHHNLGRALCDGKRDYDGAIAAFRDALRLKPDDAQTHRNLGNARLLKGQLDEAIAAYREAIRIKKDFVEAHRNLGCALCDGKRDYDGAIAAFRDALRLKPDDAETHSNLGNALRGKGRPDDAIAAYRKAICLKKDYHEAHSGLGLALQLKGQLDEAIAAYRKAIRIKKDYHEAHYDLGNALRDKGQLDEAIAAYREAIRIKKDFAEAHCNLGDTLRRQGKFREALEEFRRGHELGRRNPGWRYPSAEWVRQCERLVELAEKLPGFLDRKTRPASPVECIELAQLCTLKRLHRAAARFYEEAFDAQPRLADDLGAAHRYNAACAAALAGCGQGKDADKLDATEYARLRRQALSWLRAGLQAWGRVLNKEPDNAGPAARVTQVLQDWRGDADFSGVRGAEALAQLPEEERQSWEKLWADVADTLSRAQRKTQPEKK
jgi:tetratricopeptide (TPR) repeat protein